MTLVTRAHESGLVLAEHSADEARLRRALKEIDPRYVLQKNPDGNQPQLYVVACIVSEDQPATRILSWADDRGNPLPLSSGLIEEVKKWRPEARARRGPDADARNEQLRAETDELRREELAAISGDHRAKIERDQVTVGMGARSRHRYWQRNLRPPASGLA